MQRAKAGDRERKTMGKAGFAVVPVRTQVVPAETQDCLEDVEKVGERGMDEIKVRTLSILCVSLINPPFQGTNWSKSLEIFSSVVNPAIYLLFTTVYFTFAITSV